MKYSLVLGLPVLLTTLPALAQQMPGMTMTGMAMPPAPAHHHTPGMDMSGMAHDDDGAMAMPAALGAYPATREASGTSWQPDAEPHDGLHAMAGAWMLMGHASLQLVHSEQGGPRGGSKSFLAGMVMGMAQRPVGAATLQLRAMLSPEPLMGRAGYPLLLATGETADGARQLTDRQHPHDLFMELSASLSLPIAADTSLFVYAGLPGEPAFGPPAFMHRAAILDSPEAPITHHWLDSTHITQGVATLGLVHGRAKLEVSRFTGREPDQFRYDIETPTFDSTAVRISWNPDAHLALQASWALLKSPEQLDPQADQARWSVSALASYRLGTARWSSTLAWGQRTAREAGHVRHPLNAVAAESSLHFDAPWTIFARAEITENDELVPGAGHGLAFTVGKAGVGVIRDFRIGTGKAIGIGIQAARNFVPAGLDAAYGGDRWGGMVFARLKIG